MNTFNLTLDLAKAKQRQQQTIFVRQGDQNGTTIVATITDHGVAASTSGLTARFAMRLPDGTHYYRKAASLSGNVATVALDEAQAASAVGRTDVAYFQLLQGSTVVASTESFTVIVLPDALADATVPESYDSAIQDAIDALDEAVEQLPSTVEDVLADHPEWTTTVQDGSITQVKLATDLARDRERLLYRLANMLTATLPEGETATATDAAKTPVAGLALYGRSTQAGTATPSAPVPIVSVEPDSDGNISLLSKRTSDATQQSVTPIPLQGHELRSLPDGTRDEVTVDERGHAVLVQRVGSATLDGSSDEVWSQRIPNSGDYLLKGFDGAEFNTIVGVPKASGYPARCTRLARHESGVFSNMPDNAFMLGSSTLSGSTDYLVVRVNAYTTLANFKTWLAESTMTLDYPLATPVTHDLGTIDPVPLVGPDLTAQAIPTAPFALTYERDLNATLARLESAIATLA